jgi:hypothetical protein
VREPLARDTRLVVYRCGITHVAIDAMMSLWEAPACSALFMLMPLKRTASSIASHSRVRKETPDSQTAECRGQAIVTVIVAVIAQTACVSTGANVPRVPRAHSTASLGPSARFREGVAMHCLESLPLHSDHMRGIRKQTGRSDNRPVSVGPTGTARGTGTERRPPALRPGHAAAKTEHPQLKL